MSVSPKYLERVQVAHKKIKVRRQNTKEAERIAESFGLSSITSKILAARGFKSDTRLKNFITPSLREGLPEPTALKNLDAACALILEIRKDKKSIAICCDFDVDGLSGGAQLLHFFESIGIQSKVFVPDRFEDGYGLNEGMVRSIAEEKFELLLTVDYGTTNVKELTLAKKLGLKTIVLDHHHVTGNPPADVFVNPCQKGCGFADKVLSAAGLAWYLIAGMRSKLGKEKGIDARSYLDLACLGTICDMVPLNGANRVIAKRGLEILNTTTRPGLIALKNAIGIHREPTCTDVSFGIGPRLNAAGRMVHGEVVIELLTTGDSDKAKKIAQRLNRLNAERQDTESFVKERAIEEIKSRGILPSALIVADKEYHTGVVGIVAQRIVETFYRPAVVLGMDSSGLFKGSVRGIKGFSVVEALADAGEHLLKFGGHEGAGGLTVEPDRLDDFSRAFIESCDRRLSTLELDPYVEADTEVGLEEVEIPLIEELRGLAPFGMGNPNPVLLIKDLRVMDCKVLKGAHLKAMFTDGKRFISGLMWRQTGHPLLSPGQKVNLAFRPDINTFGGAAEIQANIQAVEKA